MSKLVTEVKDLTRMTRLTESAHIYHDEPSNDKSEGNDWVIKANRSLFIRLLLVSRSRPNINFTLLYHIQEPLKSSIREKRTGNTQKVQYKINYTSYIWNTYMNQNSRVNIRGYLSKIICIVVPLSSVSTHWIQMVPSLLCGEPSYFHWT